jgi:MOSC domain-containing protein YiiM
MTDTSGEGVAGAESVRLSGRVLAVSVSPGGIPKTPVPSGEVRETGIVGDAQEHEKHRKIARAISIQDEELLDELKGEGYPVTWGAMGENLTVRGLHVQRLSPGTRLVFSGGLELELTEVRRPCFVLDAIDPKLKEDVIGRCGFLARVVRPATVRPGETIDVARAPAAG